MAKKRNIKPSRLLVLWQKYTIFQAAQLAPSTIARDYHKVERHLEKMPSHLETSIQIRDWLIAHLAGETVRRLIMQFNACCDWAVDSDLLSYNPFTGIPRQFRRYRGSADYTGFTVPERELILTAIEADHPFYGSWAKFLFWTGCRPEEAAGLQWEHIAPDYSTIRFCKALPYEMKVHQSTKTWKTRRFPVNPRLQHLLKFIKPIDVKSADPVFVGVKGGYFDYHNFQTRQWKPTLEALVETEKVSIYLPQSHTRHTFITLALEHLPVKDVAYLVGNTPHIIWKHYASRSRKIELPEF